MIQASSLSAYAEIERRLPACCRSIYQVIFENPDICIGEIGKMLQEQNSTISGRVNDLIEDGLIHYVLDGSGKPAHKESPISKKRVQMLRANDVFTVDPGKIKQRSRSIVKTPAADQFKRQGNLFSDTNEYSAA